MKLELDSWARDLGWSVAGASAPDLVEDTRDHFRIWLERHKGPQMNYLARRANERLNPKEYFPEAQSVLCFGLYYFPGWAEGPVKVSNYAWTEDYHHLLQKKLQLTLEKLHEVFGPFSARICVDTAPVLEKVFAKQAGLGWQGKNTLLLHPEFGSALFLGEIFTSLSLENFELKLPVTDHCGTCRRCIDACPTEALEPYVLHAEKCISYWTLEHKGAFTDSTPQSFQGWVAGCDICQEVCPWNRKLIPLPSTPVSEDFKNLTRERISDPSWVNGVASTALSYVPAENWRRNLSRS